MKLTAIKQALAASEIQLTKSLGQNFLHDGNQLERIVNAAELTADDQILEIGPGLGALTEHLLKRGPKVLAIEKDRQLFEWLKEHYQQEPKLTILHADALDFLRQNASDWGDWKLVANLPYSVASTLLVELCQARSCPKRLVATLQLEVAQRLMAAAGHSSYGILSLLVQLQYRPEGWFKIPAACFFPVPDVDSACVTLARRTEPLLAPKHCRIFEKIVKRGFSQRRKMMLKLLKQDWAAAKLDEAYQMLHLSPQVRAEKVTLEQFVQLTLLLQPEFKPPS
jgi:16S rRNA (adenine1518-N6/adenine1519-N6)-dimethyltransferase